MELPPIMSKEPGDLKETGDQQGPSSRHMCPCSDHRWSGPVQPTFGGTGQETLWEHRKALIRRCELVIEGAGAGSRVTHLHSIYTSLYISQSQNEDVNKEHEVWQLETVSKVKPDCGRPIKCHEIFAPLPGQKADVRANLTKGIAGIGKTFCVQKFTLDWAEGSQNQDVDVVILLCFRELNLIADESYDLLGLIRVFHPTLRMVTAENLTSWKVLFIFDGLDENRLPLDFRLNRNMSEVTQATSVDVLLTNLIKGTLLPSALIWITSRPAAANQIPPECIDLVTEVRGFSDPQKEEYFKRRFSDANQASRVFSHIKRSRSLYIMCHIPIFCWMTAVVLEHMLSLEEGGEMPKTLTEMYARFLFIQMKTSRQKYPGKQEIQLELPETDEEVLLKLGRLALKHLEEGNLLFYEEDLEVCGLDVKHASVYSGVCTEIFKREFVLFQRPVFCFVHLSIQEFLAAVYIYYCYSTATTEVLWPFLEEKNMPLPDDLTLTVFLKRAMRKALQNRNGRLDLFVRFLHGLSLDSNRKLLEGLLPQSESDPDCIRRAIHHLKAMDDEFFSTIKNPNLSRTAKSHQMINISPQRYINISLCLMEMQDFSVYQETLKWLEMSRSNLKLTVTHCSALAYILQMSEEVQEVFDLSTYMHKIHRESRRVLLPVARNARRVRLVNSEITPDDLCETLVSILSSSLSHLMELDLSNNVLQDTGEKLLSEGLGSPHCRLETLRLADCELTLSAFQVLGRVLVSESCPLTELDLSSNPLKDSGVQLLSAGLHRLNTLKVAQCGLTQACVGVLGAVLCLGRLKALDLSRNDLLDVGISRLALSLASTDCRVEMLRLSGCLVTEEGCASLASALSSSHSHLRELDLSYNHPGPSGEKLLSAGLEDPRWRLETLSLNDGGEHMITTRLRAYARPLTLDPARTHRGLSLSEGNRKVQWKNIEEEYVPGRGFFQAQRQVLCAEGLTERCYWEVELEGNVSVGAVWGEVALSGAARDWSEVGLFATDDSYCSVKSGPCVLVARQGWDFVPLPLPAYCWPQRLGVFLDWAGGTLSFYGCSAHSLQHLHTFRHAFTLPVHPALALEYSGQPAATLCQVTGSEVTQWD